MANQDEADKMAELEGAGPFGVSSKPQAESVPQTAQPQPTVPQTAQPQPTVQPQPAVQRPASQQNGVVGRGAVDPGNRTNDPAVRMRSATDDRNFLALAADLSDSPVNGGRAFVQPAQKYYDSKGRERLPTRRELEKEAEVNAFRRREAARESSDQFRAKNRGWSARDIAEMNTMRDIFRARRARQAEADGKIRSGDFSGMTRITADNWAALGGQNGQTETIYERDANGRIVQKQNEKGEWVDVVKGRVRNEGSMVDAAKSADQIAAIEDWHRNQWKTNFNDGVSFSRYDGGFDASKLPQNLFDKDGRLDVSKMSQRQLDALTHIMRQDQAAVAGQYSQNNGGRRQDMSGTRAQRADRALDSELSEAGLDTTGMSRDEKIVVRDQQRLAKAENAVKALRDAQANGKPIAQAQLDAKLALRNAGFGPRTEKRILNGDESQLRRSVRLNGRMTSSQTSGRKTQDVETVPEELPPEEPMETGVDQRANEDFRSSVDSDIRSAADAATAEATRDIARADVNASVSPGESYDRFSAGYDASVAGARDMLDNAADLEFDENGELSPVNEFTAGDRGTISERQRVALPPPSADVPGPRRNSVQTVSAGRAGNYVPAQPRLPQEPRPRPEDLGEAPAPMADDVSSVSRNRINEVAAPRSRAGSATDRAKPRSGADSGSPRAKPKDGSSSPERARGRRRSATYVVR